MQTQTEYLASPVIKNFNQLSKHSNSFYSALFFSWKSHAQIKDQNVLQGDEFKISARKLQA